MTPRPQSYSRDPRWIPAIVFVALINLWHPVGYVGGGADDDRYIAGALCWVANGPCIPVNHWEGRWPLVSLLALSIEVFGLNRIGIAAPSIAASLTCLVLIKKIGDRFDPRIGTAAALVLGAVPVFVTQAFNTTVESLELAFILASGLAIISGRPLIAGIALGMAFQVRETSLAAFLPAAYLLRKDYRALLYLGSGFSVVLLVELVVFYAWTGEPLYRRTLSMQHVALPSSELANPPKGSPLFNWEYLRSWRYDPGIHVHWLIDGLLNLMANIRSAFLYSLTPLLWLLYRRRLAVSERRAVGFLILFALFYTSVLIYVLAIDPKARMMFVPIAALALAFAILVTRAWNPVVQVLVFALAGLIALLIAAQPRQARYQAAAERFEARFPNQIETAQPGYFALSRLRDLPAIGSGKPLLLVLKSDRCFHGADQDPLDLRHVQVVAEMRAHPIAIAVGNRWSVCLYRYVGTPPILNARPVMGPTVRIINRAVVDPLDGHPKR